MSDTNWSQIRADYESGMSLRKLEAKYGIAKSVIGKRKFHEKWSETGRTRARTVTQTQEVVHPDMNAAVRASMGFRLRFKEGKTWEEVATGAGYNSRGAAHDAVIREARRHITHDIEETRNEERYRIEQLQQRAFNEGIDTANAYWGFAVDRYVALSKRKSELLNLDVKPDELLANQNYVKKIVLTHEQEGQHASTPNG